MGLIQIRDVPDDVHRTLKARAAARGTTLSDYLRVEIERVARTPTAEELEATLITRDAGLAKAIGGLVEVASPSGKSTRRR